MEHCIGLGPKEGVAVTISFKILALPKRGGGAGGWGADPCQDFLVNLTQQPKCDYLSPKSEHISAKMDHSPTKGEYFPNE